MLRSMKTSLLGRRRFLARAAASGLLLIPALHQTRAHAAGDPPEAPDFWPAPAVLHGGVWVRPYQCGVGDYPPINITLAEAPADLTHDQRVETRTDHALVANTMGIIFNHLNELIPVPGDRRAADAINRFMSFSGSTHIQDNLTNGLEDFFITVVRPFDNQSNIPMSSNPLLDPVIFYRAASFGSSAPDAVNGNPQLANDIVYKAGFNIRVIQESFNSPGSLKASVDLIRFDAWMSNGRNSYLSYANSGSSPQEAMQQYDTRHDGPKQNVDAIWKATRFYLDYKDQFIGLGLQDSDIYTQLADAQKEIMGENLSQEENINQFQKIVTILEN